MKSLSYGLLLDRYRMHPERKFTGPDGKECGWETRGLLSDRLTIASRFVLIGKEATDLEARLAHVESEDENIETYLDPRWEALAALLRDIKPGELRKTFAVNRTTVWRWQHGITQPVNLPAVLLLATDHARAQLASLAHDPPADDWEAVSLYGVYLRRQARRTEATRATTYSLRKERSAFVAAVRAITAGKLTTPNAHTEVEWRSCVPKSLRNRKRGVPVDDVAASLASAYPHFGIAGEQGFHDYCHRLWG